jgi:hypothetical protein
VAVVALTLAVELRTPRRPRWELENRVGMVYIVSMVSMVYIVGMVSMVYIVSMVYSVHGEYGVYSEHDI